MSNHKFFHKAFIKEYQSMITKFNYEGKNLYTPVIFRPDFQVATLNTNQAWSLFFSAGQEENELGNNNEYGWFFNNLLMAVIVSGIIGSAIFTSI
jgi:hypothetical protein